MDTNIYRSHRAVAAHRSAKGVARGAGETLSLRSLGLQPWLGSDTADGPEKPWGGSYFQITDKGLSRELGYVGGYGEILGEMVDAYEAAREPGQDGDPKIKAQIAKLQRARLYFRYPMQDEEGRRAMRLETGIGWRDAHFPGAVTYAQRSGPR